MAAAMTLSAPVFRNPVSWPLLPKPTADGVLEYPDLDRSVRDSIRILLLTRPGEQLMRPLFGAGLDNFRDESNTLSVRRRIQTDITNTLQAYEDRIALDRVDVDPVDDSPGEVHIRIHYRLVRTGQSQTIGATLIPS